MHHNGHQSFGGSVRNGNEKRFSGLALNTAKQPLPLIRVASAVFALPELAFVDLDGLVRTADLRAVLHVHEHGLSAELAPFREPIITEAVLSLDTVGRFAVHDVICEKQNLLESEVSILGNIDFQILLCLQNNLHHLDILVRPVQLQICLRY